MNISDHRVNLPLNEYIDDLNILFRKEYRRELTQILERFIIYLYGNVIAFNEAINFCDISACYQRWRLRI